jgi:phosphoribosylformylglycinamidine synthase I
MNYQPKALVLEAPGINCNVETGHAIEQAGGYAEQVHMSQLQSGDRKITDYDILALSGGFSHGDAIRSGAVLGLELRTRFGEDLNEFVADGRPVIGICNGFQVLVESGLLPNGVIDDTEPKTASLIHNKNGKFECRWVPMHIGESACKFIRPDMYDDITELPVAHGEGRLIIREGSLAPSQVALRYGRGPSVQVAYPDNPNGSPDNIAGITDPSGVVLGMMPHPERFVHTTQHPNWRRGEGQIPYGAELFKGIVDYVKER